jgi:hypothetical protein
VTPEEERVLIERSLKTGTKMDMLIGDDGSTGMVPEMKERHETLSLTVSKQAEQISYWKGAIAVIALLVLALGGVLISHILGGKG